MPTFESPAAIGFRCKTCWQEIYAPVETAGQVVPCVHCEAEVEVPQPSDSNLCDIEKLTAQENKVADKEPELSDLEPEELYKLAAQEAACPTSEMDFSGYPNASLLARFFAALLDGLYGAVLGGLGLVSLVAALNLGVLEAASLAELIATMPTEALIILYFPLLIGHILQWNLIATRGQSIGKLICCIRIVTMRGQTPGFVRGVVIRSWLFCLLAGIPFLSLIDILFIFGSSQRCLHDFAADTRVVPI